MTNYFKYILTFLFGFILFPFFVNAQYQKNNPPKFTNESTVPLNKNHFFRFNDEFRISFNTCLQNGYDQYLENLVQISDLDKSNIDIVLSLESNDISELIFITNSRLIRKKINFDKEYFMNKGDVNFNFVFNLKEDKVTIAIDNTTLSESNLGLRPNTDYKVILGGKSSNQKSMIRFHDINTLPDLLDKKEFKILNQKSILS